MKTSLSYDNVKDKLEYMKSVVDVRFLLDNLGFSLTKTSRHELRSTCLIHGGDNPSSFRFNLKTRTWVCFSHNCQRDYDNDIIGLIRAVKRCSFLDAYDYLDTLTGNVSDYTHRLEEFRAEKEREDFISDFTDVSYKPKIVSENCLRQFKPFRSDLFTSDGFSKETLDYFEVAGGYTDKMGLLRDIIPIRDDKGALVAYSLRDLRRHVVKYADKYSITPGMDKDRVLYNLNNVIPILGEAPIILVEGFKSVWRLYELGIYNAAAVMGSTVTDGQKNLLCTYAKNGCVLFFDNDKAGVEGTIRSIELLSDKIHPVIPIFIMETSETGEGLDPADLNEEQIFSYLKGLF